MKISNAGYHKIARMYVKEHGGVSGSWETMTPQLSAISGIEIDGNLGARAAGKKILREIGFGKPKPKKKKKKNKVESVDFLKGYAWRKLRMQVLKKYEARCMCCGATRGNGVQLHVDHIKPRKRYPELALDINNLQILCEVCNHGKGNWDETDWRDPLTEQWKVRLVE